MSGEKIFYSCDPKKNKECRKRGCYKYGGECRATSKADCAIRDADGNPIEAFRVRDRKDGTD